MLKYIVYAVYLYIINVQKVEDKYTFCTFNNNGKSIKQTILTSSKQRNLNKYAIRKKSKLS